MPDTEPLNRAQRRRQGQHKNAGRGRARRQALKALNAEFRFV